MGALLADRPVDLRAHIERVLALGGPSVQRLGGAGTSITFVVVDDSGADLEEPVTLLLDREPPELCDDDIAEITVELGVQAAREFAAGRLVLATCLMEGHARYHGSIRKYLAVDPILRALLAHVDGSSEERDEP